VQLNILYNDFLTLVLNNSIVTAIVGTFSKAFDTIISPFININYDIYKLFVNNERFKQAVETLNKAYHKL